MRSNTPRLSGRHFLQIPGPTPVPDRILHAMAKPTIDHRGPDFQKLGHKVLEGIKTIFKTNGDVIIYPASGTGAWEAALTNVFSEGDTLLMVETGHFATLWKSMAEKLGLKPQFIESNWRTGVYASQIADALKADTAHKIKGVCVVHNETSTGCTTPILAIRQAMDAAKHPALLLVDTISSLASIDYQHDAWGVDVTVSGSQKGLMLPPGLSFTAISAKALEASKSAKLKALYWSWHEMLPHNKNGFFPYTPATNLLYALSEAIDMLHEEGLEAVFKRHLRHAEATRAAVKAWGLEVFCSEEAHYSPILTAVLLPEGHDADRVRKIILENYDMSLGTGLSKVAGRLFRIGHLGDTNDLTILGAIAGVEMGLKKAGVPINEGGILAAMKVLS
jgi:alanine-glyoxylate transaminase / serine-glyoxylate transaminase / serine-pyruvate transaminase